MFVQQRTCNSLFVCRTLQDADSSKSLRIVQACKLSVVNQPSHFKYVATLLALNFLCYLDEEKKSKNYLAH